jgi:hypothetical protein
MIVSSSLFLVVLFLYLSYDLWSDFFSLSESNTKRVDLSRTISAQGRRLCKRPTNYRVRKRVVKLETMLAALRVGYKSTSWLCCFRHKSVSHLKEEWAVPDPTEASINRAYEKRQLRHSTPYGLQYGVNIQLFSNSIDPIRQWHALWSIVRSELVTCAQAKNLVRASEQVGASEQVRASEQVFSLAAEISTQLQGICPASWLDIFCLRCSVAASNFGQVMHSCIFPTYLAHTPTTKGATVKAFKLSTSDSLHIPFVVNTGAVKPAPQCQPTIGEQQSHISSTNTWGEPASPF